MSTQELWQWVHYSYGDELGQLSFYFDYFKGSSAKYAIVP